MDAFTEDIDIVNSENGERSSVIKKLNWSQTVKSLRTMNWDGVGGVVSILPSIGGG